MESHSSEAPSRGVDPADAQEALLMVEQMRRVALRRGLPPRWLGGALSVLVGGMCGAQAADASPEVTALLLSSLLLIVTIKRRSLTALAKRSSYGFSLPIVASQFGAMMLIMALIVGGRSGFAGGLTWAPFAAGAAAAATIYLLFEFKLAQFRASIELEELP